MHTGEGGLEQGEAERSIDYHEPDHRWERDKMENIFCVKEGVDLTEEKSSLLQRLGEMRKWIELGYQP